MSIKYLKAALGVMLTDERISKFLEENDPKALEEARFSLAETEKEEENARRVPGTDLAKKVALWCNRSPNDTILKQFCDEMDRSHPTLQQIFTRLCLRWLYHLSQIQYFDARNEASVKIAREINEKVDRGLERRQHLPFI